MRYDTVPLTTSLRYMIVYNLHRQPKLAVVAFVSQSERFSGKLLPTPRDGKISIISHIGSDNERRSK